MISRLLRENGLEHVKKFIWKMFVCGGRIFGHKKEDTGFNYFVLYPLCILRKLRKDY